MRSSITKALSAVALVATFIPGLAHAYDGKKLDFPQLIDNSDPCQEIRNKLSALPKEGGHVKLEAKVYNCKQPIVIGNSNVTLSGVKETAKARRARQAQNKAHIAAGHTDKVIPQPRTTIIRLADHIHAPLLVIGDPKTIETNERHGHEILLGTRWVTKNVVVKDIEFDGNLDNHYSSKECGETNCDGDITTIRNNAISIRGAWDITLNNVSTHDSISGGVVTEKQCKRLKFIDLETYRNYFDGFAGYETVDSVFVGFESHENRGAGISIDIRFNNNVFYGGELIRNGDVGIFARDIVNNKFLGMLIENSHSSGAFFASPFANQIANCAANNEFSGVQFIGSGKSAIRINDNCPGNRFTELAPEFRKYASTKYPRTTWGNTMVGNVGCLSDDGQTPRDSYMCDQKK